MLNAVNKSQPSTGPSQESSESQSADPVSETAENFRVAELREILEHASKGGKAQISHVNLERLREAGLVEVLSHSVYEARLGELSTDEKRKEIAALARELEVLQERVIQGKEAAATAKCRADVLQCEIDNLREARGAGSWRSVLSSLTFGLVKETAAGNETDLREKEKQRERLEEVYSGLVHKSNLEASVQNVKQRQIEEARRTLSATLVKENELKDFWSAESARFRLTEKGQRFMARISDGETPLAQISVEDVLSDESRILACSISSMDKMKELYLGLPDRLKHSNEILLRGFSFLSQTKLENSEIYERFATRSMGGIEPTHYKTALSLLAALQEGDAAKACEDMTEFPRQFTELCNLGLFEASFASVIIGKSEDPASAFERIKSLAAGIQSSVGQSYRLAVFVATSLSLIDGDAQSIADRYNRIGASLAEQNIPASSERAFTALILTIFGNASEELTDGLARRLREIAGDDRWSNGNYSGLAALALFGVDPGTTGEILSETRQKFVSLGTRPDECAAAALSFEPMMVALAIQSEKQLMLDDNPLAVSGDLEDPENFAALTKRINDISTLYVTGSLAPANLDLEFLNRTLGAISLWRIVGAIDRDIIERDRREEEALRRRSDFFDYYQDGYP